jgi:hypothetical protein
MQQLNGAETQSGRYKEKFCYRCQKSNTDSSVVQLVIWSLYPLCFPDSKQNSVLWDMALCIPLKVNRRFEGTCRLHLQAACYSLHDNFLGGLSFDLKVVGDILIQNVG